jgi:cbb3-type cytochrome oxidase subunit 3
MRYKIASFSMRILFLLALFAVALPAHAWWPKGHSVIAEAAALSLPDDVPSWFRDGKGAIAHFAQDPDVEKIRALPAMTEAEFPRHFFDLELLGGRAIPPSRAELLKLTNELEIEPSSIGELPYSIAEMTQRLSVAFAETRKFPDNPYAKQKALFYAGILAHYTGDSAMPLHATLHHDGRAKADNSSPKTGIHAKIDSLIEKLEFVPADLKSEKVAAPQQIWPAIVAQIQKSNARVDATYAIESLLPPTENGEWKATPQIREWTRLQARDGAQFTAQMFLFAWRESEKVKLPTWLERP